MKIIIIIVVTLLIIYFYKCLDTKENFTSEEIIKNNYDAPNMFNVLDSKKVKPILADLNSSQISGWDNNEANIYDSRYWVVKDRGFSNIYNYEDTGSQIIQTVANNHTTIVKKKPEDNEIKQNKTAVPEEILYEDVKYKLLGTAINPYFEQYYLIYEHEVKSNLTNLRLEEELEYITNNKIYEYALVKLTSKEKHTDIQHYFGPRIKINIGDVVYLSLGTFQLGPLSIGKYK